ncbi:hypothetical protein OL233_09125 [Vagococcus sp. PNs007]|uniref:Uncharacterized protein n=1 Tax=Vagococcus proximus TaxID=2991417 RepID=A0ABT5X373_9ENTE|nr:hypothetical protein [Vagococcus proximus]MDF0480442.1 hypothetical protein [Vagococcus proximus]
MAKKQKKQIQIVILTLLLIIEYNLFYSLIGSTFFSDIGLLSFFLFIITLLVDTHYIEKNK